MTPQATLHKFIAHLRTAEVVPRPDHEDWSALILRISAPGRVHEIDEETYWYFLEVLPPKFLNPGFAFAEGAEPLQYFWQKDGKFFCRQLTWDETTEFCRLAQIPLPH